MIPQTYPIFAEKHSLPTTFASQNRNSLLGVTTRRRALENRIREEAILPGGFAKRE